MATACEKVNETLLEDAIKLLEHGKREDLAGNHDAAFQLYGIVIGKFHEYFRGHPDRAKIQQVERNLTPFINRFHELKTKVQLTPRQLQRQTISAECAFDALRTAVKEMKDAEESATREEEELNARLTRKMNKMILKEQEYKKKKEESQARCRADMAERRKQREAKQ